MMIEMLMSRSVCLWGQTPTELVARGDSGLGKWVFVGSLVLLLIWLCLMPRRLIGQRDRVPPWWRNVRFWAIVVCLLQIWVYWQFA